MYESGVGDGGGDVNDESNDDESMMVLNVIWMEMVTTAMTR